MRKYSDLAAMFYEDVNDGLPSWQAWVKYFGGEEPFFAAMRATLNALACDRKNPCDRVTYSELTLPSSVPPVFAYDVSLNLAWYAAQNIGD